MQDITKAGLIPMILTFGGWLYASILLLVLIYNFFLYIIKAFTRKKG